MKHVKIIAEAGVNHNGSEEIAIELVNTAHRAGADIVKFQTFKAKNLVTKTAAQAEYQVENTGKKESQFEMLKRLELSYEAHHKLIKHCQDLGIEFLSTAFELESLDFLVSDLGLKTLKIPSGEITNAPLLLGHARTGADLIVSTGMATLAEVEAALGVLAFGLICDENIKPSTASFKKAYFSEEGQTALKEKVTLLHCTTEYPTPMEDINLSAMDTMKNAFGLNVGYSDHSVGITVPIGAVARGAILIEKHFTLDKEMEGPDHKASLDPEELKQMVEGIRQIEVAVGNGIKGPRPSEMKNIDIARKSLIAVRAIKAGQIIKEEDITVKRPGYGRSPMEFWEIIGTPASREYDADEVIE